MTILHRLFLTFAILTTGIFSQHPVKAGFLDDINKARREIKKSVKETLVEPTPTPKKKTTPAKKEQNSPPTKPFIGKVVENPEATTTPTPDHENAAPGESAIAADGSDTASSLNKFARGPITLTKFGGVTLPSSDGRVLIGSLITRDERKVVKNTNYALNAEEREATDQMLREQGNAFLAQTGLLSRLIKMATIPDILELISADYEANGATMNRSVYEDLILETAILALPLATLQKYLEIQEKPNPRDIRPPGWKGSNNFEQTRTAKSLIAEQGPILLAMIPEFPIKVRSVKLFRLTGYDMATRTFKLNGHSVNNPTPTQLDIPTLTVYEEPRTFSMEREPAEALMNTLAEEDKYLSNLHHTGYLTTDYSIYASPDTPGASGIPSVTIESVTIHKDLLDAKPLYSFAIDQLPIPTLEGGQRIVTPDLPIPINDDSLLVILLNKKPELADQVDWKIATQDRKSVEADGNDSYGLFLPHSKNQIARNNPWESKLFCPPEQVEAFRLWTLERATNLPAQPAVQVMSSRSPTLGTLKNEIGRNNGQIFDAFDVGNLVSLPHPSHVTGFYNKLEKENNLSAPDSSLKLWRDGVRALKSTKIYVLTSGTESTYKVPWETGSQKKLETQLVTMPKGSEVSVVETAEFRLNNILLLPGKKDPAETAILDVVPVKASKSIDSTVVASKEWPAGIPSSLAIKAPEPAKPTTTPEPPQTTARVTPEVSPDIKSIPSQPYGPKLVGAQLGMTIKQTDKAIRKSFEVAAVFEATPDKDLQVPWRKVRLYCNKDWNDYIKVYYGNPANPDYVMAISKRLIRGQDQLPFEPVLNTMKNKYGEPSRIEVNEYAIWGPKNGSSQQHDFAKDWRWIDSKGAPVDGSDWKQAPKRVEQLGLNFYPPSEEGFANMEPGPTLRMQVRELKGQRTLGNADQRFDAVDVRLYDMQVAILHWREWQKSKEKKPETLDLGL